MSQNFTNQMSILLSDSSLYQALEMENFEKLKELQMNNATKSKQRYFIDKVKSLLAKQHDPEQDEVQLKQFISKCNDSLRDLIVGFDDFAMGCDIAFGASSIVYRGYFKFLEVAIKKVSLNTMYSKQVVG